MIHHVALRNARRHANRVSSAAVQCYEDADGFVNFAAIHHPASAEDDSDID